MPPIKNLDHVGIHVADVPASQRFYEEVLGLRPLPRPDLGFPGAWLRIGTEQELHLIGKNSQPGLPPIERHFAMSIDSADAFAAHLETQAIAYERPSPRPDGARQIFLRDPDGHVIELLQQA